MYQPDGSPNMQLFNSYFHKTSMWKTVNIKSTTDFCRVEMSQERYLVVIGNTSKTISVHYIPSLCIAKNIAFSKVLNSE